MVYNIVTNKIEISTKVSFSRSNFKYFIGYNDAENVRPLCILFLPKLGACGRVFSETKYMPFLIKAD